MATVMPPPSEAEKDRGHDDAREEKCCDDSFVAGVFVGHVDAGQGRGEKADCD